MLPAEVRLELRLYDPLDTLDPLLVCNDGSPGGYYYREATTREDGDKWIFYLEGGGWCWNDTSCVNRSDHALDIYTIDMRLLQIGAEWDPHGRLLAGLLHPLDPAGQLRGRPLRHGGQRGLGQRPPGLPALLLQVLYVISTSTVST